MVAPADLIRLSEMMKAPVRKNPVLEVCFCNIMLCLDIQVLTVIGGWNVEINVDVFGCVHKWDCLVTITASIHASSYLCRVS